MKKVDGILFIVHPGFDPDNQLELEKNIKLKIDSLADNTKKGVEHILFFIDEPGMDIYTLENENIIEINYQILNYLAYIQSLSAIKQIFTSNPNFPDISKQIEEEQFDEDLVKDLNLLLENEIKILSKGILFCTDEKQEAINNVHMEAFNILNDEYTKKGKILFEKFKEYKKDQLGTVSSKIPANVDRRSRLYKYAVEKLGSDRVFQTFMDDFELDNIELYTHRKTKNMNNSFFEKVNEYIFLNFNRRFGKILEIIKNNNGLEIDIGGEYYGRCVHNFTTILARSLGHKSMKSFIDKDISLIKIEK